MRERARRLKPVADVVRPRPVGRQFEYPADVSDEEALREYLSDTDIFGAATAEAAAYLDDAFERFRLTMALIPRLPDRARVLELGANPYFLTRLLIRRGYQVTCANYFGDGFSGEPVQVVTGPRSGERHVFRFDHFNVEREPFPYPDDSFDLVLFCEILEHLPSDPVHTLAEIHRVLAPGGVLLLTTPNATRTTNVVRILRGDNPYEELSGYGTYGRHNREYTVAELRLLLGELGYAVDDVFAADIHDTSPAVPRLPGLDPRDRGDNLFLLARPEGLPRWRYPAWLYSSRHALRRVVRPDLMAGHNDELQSEGLHPADDFGDGWACWTGAADEAAVVITSGAPDGAVVIEGTAPPPAVPGPITVEVSGPQQASFSVPCDGGRFAVRLPFSAPPGVVELKLRATPTWSPAALGLSTDHRRLGVAIRRVALESP